MSDWAEDSGPGDSFGISSSEKLDDGSYLYRNKAGDIIGFSGDTILGEYSGAGAGALPANQYDNVGNPTFSQQLSSIARSLGTSAFNKIASAFTTNGKTDWAKVLGAAG